MSQQTPEIDTTHSVWQSIRSASQVPPAAAAGNAINFESMSPPPPPLFQETSEILLAEPVVKQQPQQVFGRAPVRNRRTDSLASPLSSLASLSSLAPPSDNALLFDSTPVTASYNPNPPRQDENLFSSMPSQRRLDRLESSQHTPVTASYNPPNRQDENRFSSMPSQRRLDRLESSQHTPFSSSSLSSPLLMSGNYAETATTNPQQPSSLFAQSMTSSGKTPIRRTDALDLPRFQGEPDVFQEEEYFPSEPIMTKTQARRINAERAALARTTARTMEDRRETAIEPLLLSIGAAEPQKETKILSAQQRYNNRKKEAAAAALVEKGPEVDSFQQRQTDLVEKYLLAKQALDDANADVAATWKETNGRLTPELNEKQRLARRLKSEYLALKADVDVMPQLSSVNRERIRGVNAAAVPIASSSQRNKKDAERPPVTVLSSSERYKQKEAAQRSAAATTTDRENAELRATADRENAERIASDPTQDLATLLASSHEISAVPSRQVPVPRTTSSVEQPPATSGTSSFFSSLLGRFGKGGKNTHHHRKKSKSALSRKNSKRYSVKAKRRNRRKSRR